MQTHIEFLEAGVEYANVAEGVGGDVDRRRDLDGAVGVELQDPERLGDNYGLDKALGGVFGLARAHDGGAAHGGGEAHGVEDGRRVHVRHEDGKHDQVVQQAGAAARVAVEPAAGDAPLDQLAVERVVGRLQHEALVGQLADGEEHELVMDLGAGEGVPDLLVNVGQHALHLFTVLDHADAARGQQFEQLKHDRGHLETDGASSQQGWRGSTGG